MAFREFDREELAVLLDALQFYCEGRRQREEHQEKACGDSSRALERCVILAQLDERLVDARDRQLELCKLVQKKADSLDGFDMAARRLSMEILEFLENSK